MLEFTFKKDNRETTYTPLNILNAQYSALTNTIVFQTDEPHKLRTHDAVRFTKVADIYSVSEDKDTTSLGRDIFSIEPFEDYILNYSGTTYDAYQTGFVGNAPYEISALTIYFENPHDIFDESKFESIDNHIPYNYYTDEPDWYMQTPIRKACIGDTIEMNGLVYFVDGDTCEIDEDGKYRFQHSPYDETCRNKRDVIIKYTDEVGFTHAIDNGFVMVNYDGSEDLYRLVFFARVLDSEGNVTANRSSELQYIHEHSDTLVLTVQDDRFLSISGDTVTFKPVTTVYRNDNYYSLDLPISNNFRADLFDEYNYQERYLTEKMQDSINPIVDYEKRVFEPAWYDDEVNLQDPSDIDETKLKRIDEIQFNLHFRVRKDTSYSEWEPSPTDIWNNYILSSGDTSGGTFTIIPKQDGLEESDADLLSYLGYSDGDVYYQKNRFKNSFLRLLFFDTPDRRTQTLQFYSTIFFDTNSAYKKFLKAVVGDNQIPALLNVNQSVTYVSNEHIIDNRKELRLQSRFICHDRMDSDNSSDGYYLYLFPSVLNGTIPTKLYMQVQFNNAANGKVVDMVMPVDEQLNPLSIIDSGNTFPLTYTTDDSDSDDWVKFVRDRYIEVWAKYNFTDNKYQWFLPRSGVTTDADNKMTFNLYEPILTATSVLPSSRPTNEYTYTDSGGTQHVVTVVRDKVVVHVFVHMAGTQGVNIRPSTADIKANILYNGNGFDISQKLNNTQFNTTYFAVNTKSTIRGQLFEGTNSYANGNVDLTFVVKYNNEESPIQPNTGNGKNNEKSLEKTRITEIDVPVYEDDDLSSQTGRRSASPDFTPHIDIEDGTITTNTVEPTITNELPEYLTFYVNCFKGVDENNNPSDPQPIKDVIFKQIPMGATGSAQINKPLESIYNEALTKQSEEYYHIYLEMGILAFPRQKDTPTPVPPNDNTQGPIENDPTLHG